MPLSWDPMGPPLGFHRPPHGILWAPPWDPRPPPMGSYGLSSFNQFWFRPGLAECAKRLIIKKEKNQGTRNARHRALLAYTSFCRPTHFCDFCDRANPVQKGEQTKGSQPHERFEPTLRTFYCHNHNRVINLMMVMVLAVVHDDVDAHDDGPCTG